MNSKLFSKLVEKKIITLGTNVEANYLGKNLDGNLNVPLVDEFIITKITKKDTFILTLEKDQGKVKVRAVPEAILNVDGMAPRRLADICNVKEDGSTKKVKLDEFGNPVRRGRKPKHREREESYD